MNAEEIRDRCEEIRRRLNGEAAAQAGPPPPARVRGWLYPEYGPDLLALPHLPQYPCY